MKCYSCAGELPKQSFGISPRTGQRLRKCRECVADLRRRNKHRMTLEQKVERVTEQNGCAICGTKQPGTKGWAIDHDRSTCHPGDYSCADCRRGILCFACNSALGYAADDPVRLRRMADYIELETRLAEPSQSTESVQRIVRDERTNVLTNVVSELRANPYLSNVREKSQDVIKQAAIEYAKPLPVNETTKEN